ncbi:MAG: TonB-dependent receptor [Bacteroidetes bacterium]|nr:MAG: TonB-dependent receptor [Bacteroidota bacterium]
MRFFLLGLILSFPLASFSQGLQGKVMEQTSPNKSSPLTAALVFWKGTTTSALSEADGKFRLAWPDSFPAKLITRMIGYETDTMLFSDSSRNTIVIALRVSKAQGSDTVTVRGKQNDFSIPGYRPINTEIITNRGLQSAACCNLSESFERNPSVDAALTDAVSGARKIQMLGLDGVYTQILNENLPLIRGLSAAYGIGQVPGTWIKSILITKGTGSVVNGYESISGQINLDLLKPQQVEERYFVNVYGNHQGRLEGNLHAAHNFSEKIGTMLFAHYSQLQVRNDMNNDGFLNMPLYRQYNVMNRWNWNSKKGFEGQFGIRVLDEDRQGGQTDFVRDRDYGTTNAYGIGIRTQQAEFYNKTGYVFQKPGTSIGTMFSARYHKQGMFFGLREYDGEQKSIYANVIFQTYINNTNHTFKAGSSYVLDDYSEMFRDSAFGRIESVPGIFTEYTGNFQERFSMVAGLRGDLHNKFGAFVTPRLHLKYNLTEKTIFRASGGRGFRTANIFVENIGIFASSRILEIPAALQPEIAWNYGGSFTHEFKLFKNDAIINVDYFRTDFKNQVVIDIEDRTRIRFYNLNGLSFANSAQADFSCSPVERFDIRLAYKWYDVRTTYSGELKQRPLQAQHRALLNLAYALPFDRWKFDATAKWFGPARLPQVSADAINAPSPVSSDPYFLFSAQVTKKFRRFDIYLGSENIANFMQPNPIIDPANPFGPDFDASVIYAPVEGRVIYIGLRASFK